MRTENDVRQALRDREREAARAEDVLPRLQFAEPLSRRGRRRTYYLAAATCAAVAAVVVVAMLVAGHRREGTATTPSPTPKVTSSVVMPLGPKFEFNFGMADLPAGYAVLKQTIAPGFQWIEIGRKQPPGCGRPARVEDKRAAVQPPGAYRNCSYGASSYSVDNGYVLMADVLVFDKGQFNPSLMKNATPIDVDGAQGLAADVTPINDTVKWSVASIMDPTKPPKLSTIAWQYSPDSWAVVAWRNNTDFDVRKSALRVAYATRIGQTHPALVPFKIDYLPAAVDRRWNLTFGGPGDSSVGFGNAASTYWPGLHLGTPNGALPISVASAPLGDYVKHREKGDVSLAVQGHDALYSPKRSALFVSCGATCTLLVGYGGLGAHLAGSMSEAELIKVAEHITVAPSLSDTSTWFDAAYALPH